MLHFSYQCHRVSLSDDADNHRPHTSLTHTHAKMQELVGHCTALYQHNARAIASLESHLQSYGYSSTYPPTSEEPQQHPSLVLTTKKNDDTDDIGQDTTDTIPTAIFASSPIGGLMTSNDIDSATTTTNNTTNNANAKALLAPMTAAKARALRARDDTPTPSATEPSPTDALTPSMRHLLGKYASTASYTSGRLSSLSIPSFSMSSPRTGGREPMMMTGATMRAPPSGCSPSPVPLLSPAFAKAAEEQRISLSSLSLDTIATTTAAKEEEEKEKDEPLPLASTHPLPLPLPLSPTTNDITMDDDINLEAIDSYLASTAKKLAQDPQLFSGAFKQKYPHIHSAASLTQQDQYSRLGMDEENTMELKSQVIFNRFQQQQQQQQLAGGVRSRTNVQYPSSALDATAAATTTTTTTTTTTDARDGNRKESLDDVIAAALGHPAPPPLSVPSVPSVPPSTKVNAAVTPSNPPHPSLYSVLTRTGGGGGGGGGAGTATSLTPSLPTTVPPLRIVDETEFSSLPSFITNQISLDELNQTLMTVHNAVVRRCAGGDGAVFTLDDVEAAGVLPAGKCKVFTNTLVKLARVQLRVVYGQGTVYFFCCPS